MSRTAQSRAKERPDELALPEVFVKEPIVEEIQARAYELYLERGGVDGHQVEDWLAAERELRER